MSKHRTKHLLVDYLKSNGYLWSFDKAKIDELPDSVILELIMVHGDIEQIDLLPVVYESEDIKKVWETALLPNPRYENIAADVAFALFGYDKPFDYVRDYRRSHVPQ